MGRSTQAHSAATRIDQKVARLIDEG